ncbi:MAG: integration host factor subunit beta [Candidatus Methylomirabilota bacterium]|nr:MAG: integration host factor subunit beta [candidate division NC10 bacterium]
MTKADLVELVAARVYLTKKDTEVVIDTILDSITRALASHDDGKVELRGFGSFRTRQRRARQGRNPQSGQAVHVPSKRIPFFKPGKELRQLIDN